MISEVRLTNKVTNDIKLMDNMRREVCTTFKCWVNVEISHRYMIE